jgi:hypothetical protein
VLKTADKTLNHMSELATSAQDATNATSQSILRLIS